MSSSNSSNSPNLLNDSHENVRKYTIEHFAEPYPRLTYRTTEFREPLPYRFSEFRVTVNPSRVSEQALDRQEPHRPFVNEKEHTSKHYRPLTPPPNINTHITLPGQLDGWEEVYGKRSRRWG